MNITNGRGVDHILEVVILSLGTHWIHLCIPTGRRSRDSRKVDESRPLRRLYSSHRILSPGALLSYQILHTLTVLSRPKRH